MRHTKLQELKDEEKNRKTIKQKAAKYKLEMESNLRITKELKMKKQKD